MKIKKILSTFDFPCCYKADATHSCHNPHCTFSFVSFIHSSFFIFQQWEWFFQKQKPWENLNKTMSTTTTLLMMMIPHGTRKLSMKISNGLLNSTGILHSFQLISSVFYILFYSFHFHFHLFLFLFSTVCCIKLLVNTRTLLC